MKKLFIAIVLVLSIVFIIASISEIETIIQTLRRGEWLYLLLAVFTEGLWLLNLSATFHALYKAVGIENETVLGFLPVISTVNFVNIVAPSAGASGVTILIARARQKKYSPARATVASALFIESDYLGFLVVLAVGMIVLIRRNNLNTAEISAAAILVLVAFVFACLLFLGMRSEQALGKALVFLTRVANFLLRPLIHRNYLKEAHALEFAHDVAEGLEQLKSNPKRMVMPILFALINKALLLSNFTLVFLAFHVPISIGTIIAGFSIGYLFMIVSPTPAGIGIVEGSLTLALTSMYIPLGIATILTMAYRGITFWMPLLVGLLSFRWFNSHKQLHEQVALEPSDILPQNFTLDPDEDIQKNTFPEVKNH